MPIFVGTDKCNRVIDIARGSNESRTNLVNHNERWPRLVGTQRNAYRLVAWRIPNDYDQTFLEFAGRSNVKTNALRKGDIADHPRRPCNHFKDSWLSRTSAIYNPKVDPGFNLG
jgi:hypothetical protein